MEDGKKRRELARRQGASALPQSLQPIQTGAGREESDLKAQI
jgi:hypothetical protein